MFRVLAVRVQNARLLRSTYFDMKIRQTVTMIDALTNLPFVFLNKTSFLNLRALSNLDWHHATIFKATLRGSSVVESSTRFRKLQIFSSFCVVQKSHLDDNNDNDVHSSSSFSLVFSLLFPLCCYLSSIRHSGRFSNLGGPPCDTCNFAEEMMQSTALCWIRNTQPKAWNKWLEDKSFLETYIMALLARFLSWKAEQNNNNFQIVGFMYSNSSNKNLLGHFCLAFLVADVSKTRYIFPGFFFSFHFWPITT